MVGRHVIHDAVLEYLVPNAGNRCTLVCAASLLRLAGSWQTGITLADEIGQLVGFRPETGPPALAYLSRPGGRPPLDLAIERVGAATGACVRSTTRFLPSPRTILMALDNGWPIVLNVVRAPSGTWSHSIIAYGYRYDRAHGVQVLVADPNEHGHHAGRWAHLYRPWEINAATATFIRPVQATSTTPTDASEGRHP